MTRPADPSEREQIVAWLHGVAYETRDRIADVRTETMALLLEAVAFELLNVAKAIERGDHLQSGEGE